MKWQELKDYVQMTVEHGKKMENKSFNDKGFLFAFEDILETMKNLEENERVETCKFCGNEIDNGEYFCTPFCADEYDSEINEGRE